MTLLTEPDVPDPVTPEELEGVAASLDPAVFPADREELLEDAVRHHAPSAVIERIHSLPTRRRWDSIAAVLRELGIVSRPG